MKINWLTCFVVPWMLVGQQHLVAQEQSWTRLDAYSLPLEVWEDGQMTDRKILFTVFLFHNGTAWSGQCDIIEFSPNKYWKDSCSQYIDVSSYHYETERITSLSLLVDGIRDIVLYGDKLSFVLPHGEYPFKVALKVDENRPLSPLSDLYAVGLSGNYRDERPKKEEWKQSDLSYVKISNVILD